MNDVTDAFREDGFAVIPELLGAGELDELRAEAAAIASGRRGACTGLDDISEDDGATALAIHFPHKLSDRVREAMRHPTLVERLTEAVGPNVKAVQSMLFFKGPGQPGQAWHQDEAHIPTRDRSLVAAWIALDDATVDNGCLWALPGSHRSGVIWPRRDHDDPRWDGTPEAFGFSREEPDGVPLEVSAGSAVLFHGYLLHRSLPNRSCDFRRALVVHYMRAESLLPWGMTRADQPVATADYRDVVMVAGDDPYADSGYIDANEPYVRPASGPPVPARRGRDVPARRPSAGASARRRR